MAKRRRKKSGNTKKKESSNVYALEPGFGKHELFEFKGSIKDFCKLIGELDNPGFLGKKNSTRLTMFYLEKGWDCWYNRAIIDLRRNKRTRTEYGWIVDKDFERHVEYHKRVGGDLSMYFLKKNLKKNKKKK